MGFWCGIRENNIWYSPQCDNTRLNVKKKEIIDGSENFRNIIYYWIYRLMHVNFPLMVNSNWNFQAWFCDLKTISRSIIPLPHNNQYDVPRPGMTDGLSAEIYAMPLHLITWPMLFLWQTEWSSMHALEQSNAMHWSRSIPHHHLVCRSRVAWSYITWPTSSMFCISF